MVDEIEYMCVLGDNLFPGVYPSLTMELEGWEARVLWGVVNLRNYGISRHFVYTSSAAIYTIVNWNLGQNQFINGRSSFSYEKEAVMKQTAWLTKPVNLLYMPQVWLMVHWLVFIYLHLVCASLQYNWPHWHEFFTLWTAEHTLQLILASQRISENIMQVHITFLALSPFLYDFTMGHLS